MKILPCPFCGAIPKAPAGSSCWNIGWGNHYGWSTASIDCPNRCCFVLGKYEKPTEKLAVKEAIRRWNIRK
jgi:hypothetical protein